MAEVTVQTPYATAIPFMAGDVPGWLDEYNAQRLASYDLYDDLYDNIPDTVQLMLRGTDEMPIYVPTAKRLINTLARYVGKGWGYAIDPTSGTPEARSAALVAFGTLFAREKVLSQFASGKISWLRRGDWIWYISADPNKPEGRRISMSVVDPRTYFPITDENNPDKITGAELVEEFLRGETVVLKVQRWLKPSNPEHPDYDEETPNYDADIAYEANLIDLEDWQNPAKRKNLETLVELDLLPGIKSLPLYHLKNGDVTQPFGKSELSGLESIIAGINQSVSDEDLALAMAGLGMFHTDGPPPTDEEGNVTNWMLGPQMVVETSKGIKFDRVSGVATVEPTQTHVEYLEDASYGTSGIPELALGRNGTTAKSGIALALELSPLLDAADEKDLEINSTFDQIFHDLATMWFPEYEGIQIAEVNVTSGTDPGDRIPFDRDSRWRELVEGYEAGFFSAEFVQAELVRSFGYELTLEQIENAADAAAGRDVAADAGARRSAAEQGVTDDGAA